MKKNIFVKDIMTTDVITGKITDTFNTIACLMKNHDVGLIPILNQHELIGVITDRDIVIRGVFNNISSKSSIEKYITKNITTINSDLTIDDALKLMKESMITRLLVVENKKLIGIISIFDILNVIDDEKVINTVVTIKACTSITPNNQTDIQEFEL